MSVMAKILDLDADLGLDDAPTHTRPIKMLGRNWTLICDLNSYALSNLSTGDPAAIVQFLNGIIIEDERADFAKALSTVPNLTPEKLGTILGKLVEAASDRPLSPPSALPRGGSKMSTTPKSARTSSAPRAIRSVK